MRYGQRPIPQTTKKQAPTTTLDEVAEKVESEYSTNFNLVFQDQNESIAPEKLQIKVGRFDGVSNLNLGNTVYLRNAQRKSRSL